MEFQQLVRFRRSIRRFAALPVEKETLEKLVDAARYAPSAGNGQPWHFYAVQTAEVLSRLKQEVYPAEWFAAAPAVIVVTMDRERAEKKYQQRGLELYAFQDTAAAMQNMLLCAADLGLAACWVGAFDEEACRRVLALPAHLRPVVMMPVGYPVADALLADAVMPKRAPLEKILDFV